MRSIAIALLLGTLGFVARTNDDNLIFTLSALNGPFALRTVNGTAVPAAVFDSANPPLRLDALAGAITVKPNNAFSDVTTFRQTLRGVVSTGTVTCTGTYTAVGNVFEFVEAGATPDCGFTFTGVFERHCADRLGPGRASRVQPIATRRLPILRRAVRRIHLGRLEASGIDAAAPARRDRHVAKCRTAAALAAAVLVAPSSGRPAARNRGRDRRPRALLKVHQFRETNVASSTRYSCSVASNATRYDVG